MTAHTYASYANSGVAWIGAMPAHWDVSQIRYQARLESGHTPSRSNPDFWKNCHIPWFTLADVWQIRRNGQRVVTETEEKISDLGLRHSSARLLPEGSVILSRTASVGFPAILGIPMAVSQDFAVWTCGHRLSNHFLWYVLQAMRGELHRVMMGSTHQTIYMGDIEQFQTPLPPKYEQQVIVDFLDHETARIDALIEEQKRLIELLEEERESYVFSVVSKGVDPAPSMIDTGVPRLGKIPAHWHAAQLGVLSRHIQTGPFGSQLHSADYIEGGCPLINPANIQSGKIVPDSRVTVSDETVERLQHQRLKNGDLIIGRRGQMGRAAVITCSETGWLCGTGCLTLTPSKRLHPEYLSMYLRSRGVQEALRVESVGSTMDNLNPEILSRIVVPVPPLEEQDTILESVSDRDVQAERLLNEAKSGVALLNERRSAIISAAVTGKIDVRERDQSAPATDQFLPHVAEKEGRYG